MKKILFVTGMIGIVISGACNDIKQKPKPVFKMVDDDPAMARFEHVGFLNLKLNLKYASDYGSHVFKDKETGVFIFKSYYGIVTTYNPEQHKRK